jgi:hypothetical protein
VQHYRSLPCYLDDSGTTTMLVAQLTRTPPFVLARPANVAQTERGLGISAECCAALNAAPGSMLHAVGLP